MHTFKIITEMDSTNLKTANSGKKKQVSHIEGVMSINVVTLQMGYSCASLKDWYFMPV